MALFAMAHVGAYRTAAARASQYRLELDHLKHSRDNAMRREHELERALDEERHRSSTREAELKRNLRNAKCDTSAAFSFLAACSAHAHNGFVVLLALALGSWELTVRFWFA